MPFAPTPEQQAIIDAAKTGQNLAITAGAGTGKTTTLKQIANAIPGRGLYLAYNKAIATDAKDSFPRHVQCMTAHAIAWHKVVKDSPAFRNRLNAGRMQAKDQASLLGINGPSRLTENFVAAPWQLMRLINGTVRHFCYSADAELQLYHVPRTPGLDDEPADRVHIQRLVLPFARKLWADVSSESGKLPFQHDHYLKLWTLPDENGETPQARVDYILFDEAQDANPCIAQLVLGQRNTQQIAVGDEQQAIYGWRGAKDALSTWPAQHRLQLSQSWRFGQAIADEANRWLGLNGAALRLTGNPNLNSEVRDVDEPDAVLCRTNGGCMSEVLAALDEDRKPALVGGGGELRKLAEAAQELKSRGRTAHPELWQFTSWGQVQDCVEDGSAEDLAVAVRLIDEHTPEGLIECLGKLVDERQADVVISTVHKAKGREWNRVRVGNDFKAPRDKDGQLTEPNPAEVMLAYVTVTRAKHQLDRGSLSWIDNFVIADDSAKDDEPEPEYPRLAVVR
jgi:hypothetical protein